MKILFLPHNGKLYGSNKSLLSVMVHMAKNNSVSLFVPFKNNFGDILDYSKIDVMTAPYYASIMYIRVNPKYVIYPFLVLLDIIVFPYLLYKTFRLNPDVIYSNSSVENIGLLLARILGKKHITHVREFGDLDFDFRFIFGRRNKQNFLNHSNGLIFNSKIVESIVLPKQLQKVKSAVIYNGIKFESHYAAKLILPIEKITFGIVGYIQSNKGQLEAVSYLIKHLKSNINQSIKIFGDGSPKYVQSIQTLVNFHKISDRVEFMGFKKNVAEIYSEIDILLVFAKNEAFGRVTVEAMQYGIPVIAYNGGGTKELIQNGLDGLLFNNEAEFDSLLISLLASSEMYKNISANARKKVQSMFSEEVYCQNVEEFIYQV